MFQVDTATEKEDWAEIGRIQHPLSILPKHREKGKSDEMKAQCHPQTTVGSRNGKLPCRFCKTHATRHIGTDTYDVALCPNGDPKYDHDNLPMRNDAEIKQTIKERNVCKTRKAREALETREGISGDVCVSYLRNRKRCCLIFTVLSTPQALYRFAGLSPSTSCTSSSKI